MSRTKGSLNKSKKQKVVKVVKKYRKRGRPKKTKVAVKKAVYDMSLVKRYKFLGYCKKCQSIISEKELVSKVMYNCPGCNKKDRISKLLKEIEREDKGVSKKEYLNNTIHTTVFESLPLNPAQIGSNDLRIQD